MAKSKQSKSAHDRKVRQEAARLQKQGFDVQADVSGFSKPKTLGGYQAIAVFKMGRDKRKTLKNKEITIMSVIGGR